MPLNAKEYAHYANFVLTTFGAAHMSIAKGRMSVKEITAVIISGNYEIERCVPSQFFDKVFTEKQSEIAKYYTDEDVELVRWLLKKLQKMNRRNANNLIPIDEFCKANPELREAVCQ